jgi:hypothetical protein
MCSRSTRPPSIRVTPGAARFSFPKTHGGQFGDLRRLIACERYLPQYQITVAAGKAACKETVSQISREAPEELVRAIMQSRKG